MPFNPGINAVAIFEDNTPQTFVIDGHDLSTDSPDQSMVTRNSGKGTLKKVVSGFDWTLMHDQESVHNNLDGADHSNLQWKLVVWTFNGVLFVLDQASFVPEPVPQFDPVSEDYPYQVQYQVPAAYNKEQGTDILAAYRESQNQGDIANGTTNVTERIPFPFEGAELTLYNGATSITVEAFDAYSGGASLGTTTTNTGSGRVSATLTLPPNTRSVAISIDDFQDAALMVGNTPDPNA